MRIEIIDAGDGKTSDPGRPIDRAINEAMTDGWFRGRSERSVARLDSILRANPPGPTATPERYYQLASFVALLGYPDRARAMAREAEALVRDSVARRNTHSLRVGFEGDMAMAEGRAADAAAAYRRADVGGDGLPEGCSFCTPAFAGMAYDRANQADSAIANLERYLNTTSPGRVGLDRWLMAPAHKRLGELYEAKGDTKRAAEQYAAFVELWKRADPDLQPKVTEVRTRLERLRRTMPQ